MFARKHYFVVLFLPTPLTALDLQGWEQRKLMKLLIQYIIRVIGDKGNLKL